MAPSQILDVEVELDKCSLPFFDSSGGIVFFDVQSAESGTFTVPGVIELETYEPDSVVTSSWIFFKGDPEVEPQPEHPYDMPFDTSTKFSLDIVDADDTSTVIRQLMASTNSSVFWNGGSPFDREAKHSIYGTQLDKSCKYYSFAQMLYRWPVPKELESEEIFRLKLTTDEPLTTHFSGKLQILPADSAASSQSSISLKQWQITGLHDGYALSFASAGLLFALFLSWVGLRIRRQSGQIALA